MKNIIKKEERIKIYNKAMNKWGWVAQTDQTIEEMAELMVAFNKQKRNTIYKEKMNKDEIDDNLFIELADVYICLEQMINYFGKEKVEEKINSQLTRLNKRLN